MEIKTDVAGKTIISIKKMGVNQFGGNYKLSFADGTEILDNLESIYLVYFSEMSFDTFYELYNEIFQNS